MWPTSPLGNRIANFVPSPGLLSTSMVPRCSLTIQATKLRPSPNPRSGDFSPGAPEPGRIDRRCGAGTRPEYRLRCPQHQLHFAAAIVQGDIYGPPSGVYLIALRDQIRDQPLDLDAIDLGQTVRRKRSGERTLPLSAGIPNCSRRFSIMGGKSIGCF